MQPGHSEFQLGLEWLPPYKVCTEAVAVKVLRQCSMRAGRTALAACVLAYAVGRCGGSVPQLSAAAAAGAHRRTGSAGVERLRGGGYDPFAKSKDGAGGAQGGKGGMSDAERRIQDIEQEMARTQKNKATMGHLCALKARLAALKRTVVEQQTKKSTGPGEGFDVRATGDARVGFIGSRTRLASRAHARARAHTRTARTRARHALAATRTHAHAQTRACVRTHTYSRPLARTLAGSRAWASQRSSRS